MNWRPPHRPRIAVALAIAAGSLVAAGDGDAGAPPAAPPVTVTVTNPGDAATAIDLTPVATVGETVVTSTTTAMIGAVSGPGGTDNYDITSTDTQRLTVTAAAPDGSQTVAYVVEESAATAEAGDPDDAYSPELDVLQGLPLEADLDPHGAMTALRAAAGATPTAEQLAAIATYTRLGETGPIVSPAEPVGVGATWTAILRYPANWCVLPIDYSYRLASITGDRVTIEYSWTAEVSPVVITTEREAELAGISVAATISGTGTVEQRATGANSTLRSQGHYRFVFTAASAQAIDEFDLWEESIATPG